MVYATSTDLYWNNPEDKGEAAVRRGISRLSLQAEGGSVPFVLSRISKQALPMSCAMLSKYTVSASVGIYKAGYDEISDFKEMLKKSDKLMYMDKAKKKLKR